MKLADAKETVVINNNRERNDFSRIRKLIIIDWIWQGKILKCLLEFKLIPHSEFCFIIKFLYQIVTLSSLLSFHYKSKKLRLWDMQII